MEVDICWQSEKYLLDYYMAYHTYLDIIELFCLLNEPILQTGFMPKIVRFLEKQGYLITLDKQEGIFIKPIFEIQYDTIKFHRNDCNRKDCVCCKNMELL